MIEKDENGDMVELRCVNCEDGKYTFTKGLFGSCCDCPEGKSTVGGQAAICDGKCSASKFPRSEILIMVLCVVLISFRNITKTCSCNMPQFLKEEKMITFR